MSRPSVIKMIIHFSKSPRRVRLTGDGLMRPVFLCSLFESKCLAVSQLLILKIKVFINLKARKMECRS